MRFVSLFVLLFSFYTFGEVNTIARSPRGLLMGDAFTAVADDEYALFYNPAALGRHSGFTFNSLNPLVTVLNPVNHLDIIEDFPDTTAGITDALLGIPIKTSLNFTPGFRMGRFGFSAFYGTDVTFNLMDKTQPVVDIEYKEDRGFAMGYAFVSGKRLDSPTASGKQLSVGVGVKYLKRRGLKDLFPVIGTDLGNLEGSDIEEMADSLGANNAAGWGFDLGIEHISAKGGSRWINSLVMKDMFNMRLSHERPDSEVPAQDMAVNIGTAFQQNYEIFSATFSVDIRNLLEEMDFLRRVHAGVEFSMPGLSVMAGWRTGYYSYGVMFNIMLFKLYVGLFSEETNPGYEQQRADQALIYLSFLSFRFNE